MKIIETKIKKVGKYNIIAGNRNIFLLEKVSYSEIKIKIHTKNHCQTNSFIGPLSKITEITKIT